MNTKQKRLLQVGIVVGVLMGFVPPWTTTLNYENLHIERPGDYSLIFDPPSVAVQSGVKIDFGRLVVQWVALAIAIGGGLFFFQEPAKIENEKKPS
jgi:hypothetical protein